MRFNNTVKILIVSVLQLTMFSAFAQNAETEIKNVTVFRNGAMVERSGKLNIAKGDMTLYINNLSTELDPNTIKIGFADKSIKILSVKHETEIVDNEKAQKQSAAEEQRIDILKDSLSFLKSQISILTDEAELIKANRNIGGQQNGVSTNELKSMTDFYKKELSDIAAKQLSANKKAERYQSEILRLMQDKRNRQKDLQKKESRVKVIISSDRAISDVPLTISYMVFSASWEPFYEIRVDATDKPLDMVYGAHISQQSTEDWNGVKLTVSTGDPSIGNGAPEYEPMYLPPVRRQAKTQTWAPPVAQMIYGTIVDETEQPVYGAAIVEDGTTNGTISDMDGHFKLKMNNIAHSLSFHFLGYKSVTLQPAENMYVEMEPDQSSLAELVVVGYGAARDTYDDDYAPKPESPKEIKYNKEEKNIPLQLSQTQTSNEFTIDVPYTIPCDGNVHDVSMLTYHIDADYRYYSQPRQSKSVYLLADIKNISQYPLLNGNAYVYLDNVYQGECELIPDLAADTFAISIGRDKDLVVNRQEVKNFTTKKIIGQTVKVTKCFEITIRNNKNTTANVEVADQYPLPKYSDIKVDVTDKGGATIDTERGKLTWRLTLAPQEKRVLRFSYEVKYPRSSYSFTVE